MGGMDGIDKDTHIEICRFGALVMAFQQMEMIERIPPGFFDDELPIPKRMREFL